MCNVRLGNCTFLGAINAWVALGASEDATARAAARALDALVWRVVRAASRSLSLTSGAVVAAVARGAASAPVLRLDADAGVVARALAPAVAVEAPSSTFGLEAASPTPEVVMADASASTSGGAALEDVAPAPAAADGYESDGSLTLDQLRERARLRQDAASSDDDSDDEDQDSFQAIAPDAEDVEDALEVAESTGAASIDLATVRRWLDEAVPERIFIPGLKDACSAHCKARYVALPPLGKLLFHVRLRRVTFVGAINAWVALGASEDATARAAARALDSLMWHVVHAASRSSSLAAGAVVADVARGAASAPVLRLDADASVASALAPADAVEAPSPTFGLEAALPTPEIVMTDASASTSAGAALEGVAPAPAAVEEALQNAESEEVAATSSHLATLQRYLAEAVREDIFRPGLRDACSAHCASRAWRISSGVTMETGDQAALLAVLKAKGVDVEGLDPVRGGARYNFSRRPSLRDFVAAIDRPTPSYPRRPKMQHGSTPSATTSGPPRNTPSTTRSTRSSRARSGRRTAVPTRSRRGSARTAPPSHRTATCAPARFTKTSSRTTSRASESVAPVRRATHHRRRSLAVPQQRLRRRPRGEFLRCGVQSGVQRERDQLQAHAERPPRIS